MLKISPDLPIFTLLSSILKGEKRQSHRRYWGKSIGRPFFREVKTFFKEATI